MKGTKVILTQALTFDDSSSSLDIQYLIEYCMVCTTQDKSWPKHGKLQQSFFYFSLHRIFLVLLKRQKRVTYRYSDHQLFRRVGCVHWLTHTHSPRLVHWQNTEQLDLGQLERSTQIREQLLRANCPIANIFCVMLGVVRI